MKFSSALTVTTVISIMSTVHGAPVPNTEPIHFRRHSSVSELSDRQIQANADASTFMDNLNAAFEPGNGIGKLLNFVKRQMGSTDSTNDSLASSSSSTSGGSGSSGSSHSSGVYTGGTQYNPPADSTQTDNSGGLMGGDLGSPEEAGFAHEPGQGLRAT